MAFGGLMQLVAYGAQDIYLQPRYEKYFKIRVAKFMYYEYLSHEFGLTFGWVPSALSCKPTPGWGLRFGWDTVPWPLGGLSRGGGLW